MLDWKYHIRKWNKRTIILSLHICIRESVGIDIASSVQAFMELALVVIEVKSSVYSEYAFMKLYVQVNEL